jgi:hypothetical protein
MNFWSCLLGCVTFHRCSQPRWIWSFMKIWMNFSSFIWWHSHVFQNCRKTCGTLGVHLKEIEGKLVICELCEEWICLKKNEFRWACVILDKNEAQPKKVQSHTMLTKVSYDKRNYIISWSCKLLLEFHEGILASGKALFKYLEEGIVLWMGQ